MSTDHKANASHNCCAYHFTKAYSQKPLEIPKFKYEWVFLVDGYSEAQNVAKSLCIPKEDFRYCHTREQIVGFRLPTEKQLFIDARLDTIDNYLHSRFSRIVLPDMTIVKPNLNFYQKF